MYSKLHGEGGGGYQSDSSGIVVDDEANPYNTPTPQLRHNFRVGVGNEENTPLVGGTSSRKFQDRPVYASEHGSGLLFAIRQKRDAILAKIKPHMKKIKIAILFLVLLFGIIAFATTDEPEVDNTFALSAAYGLISFYYIFNLCVFFFFLFFFDQYHLIPLNEDYPKGFVQLHATSIQPVSHFPTENWVFSQPELHVTLQLQQKVNNVWIIPSPQEDYSVTLVIQEAVNDTNSDHFNIASGGGEGGSNNPSVLVVWKLPTENPDFRLNLTTNSDEPVPLGLQIRQHSSVFQYKVFGHCAFMTLTCTRSCWVHSRLRECTSSSCLS